MFKITFLCDRCNRVSSGRYNPKTNETEGFYYVKSGDFRELNRGKEKNVCEKCIDGEDFVPICNYPKIEDEN